MTILSMFVHETRLACSWLHCIAYIFFQENSICIRHICKGMCLYCVEWK